jgi:hypothetical protein
MFRKEVMRELDYQEKYTKQLYDSNFSYIRELHKRIESLEEALDNIVTLGYTKVKDVTNLKSEVSPKNLYLMHKHIMYPVYEIIRNEVVGYPPTIITSAPAEQREIDHDELYRRNSK